MGSSTEMENLGCRLIFYFLININIHFLYLLNKSKYDVVMEKLTQAIHFQPDRVHIL